MIDPDKLFGRLGNRMFQMAYIYNQVSKGEVPDIYLQDEKFFEGCSDYVKHVFGDDIKPNEYIAIHIRRGDYVDNDFYADLTLTDYYKKAIAQFPEGKFLVFSDDIGFAMKFFNDENSHRMGYCGEQNAVDALNLMAGCKHHIIANSSFSWWAAYLNPNPNKIIIAPLAWYSDGVERTKCPESWIRI